jgi:hypothetical protein
MQDSVQQDRELVAAHVRRRIKLEIWLVEHRRRYWTQYTDEFYRQRLAEDLIDQFEKGKL